MWGTWRLWGMSAASWLADGYAVFHSMDVVRLRICAGSSAVREPVRAHDLEGPRWLFQGRGLGNCPDARRVYLARYGIRLASFRWRPGRPVAAARQPVAPFFYGCSKSCRDRKSV